MLHNELTRGVAAATSCPMRGLQMTRQTTWGSGWRAARAGLILITGPVATGGCISVTAPDKPIVIELNINIKQEVVYRLSADAANTIEKNPEIF
ncbi:MAG: YnbE family lipoprotein [Novosphingobium sp.]